MSEHGFAEGEMDAAAERTLALVAARAGATGTTVEALVRATAGTSALTRFANSRIHQNVVEDVTSLTLAVAVGGRVARVTTTRVDEAALVALAERALAAAALRPADPDFAGFAPPAPVPVVDHADEATATASAAARAEVVASFVAAAREATLGAPGAGVAGGLGPGAGGAAGAEAAGYCATRVTTTVLASSTGQRATSRVTAADLDGVVRAAPAGLPADGAAQATSHRLADLDGAACGARAAAKARAGLTAVALAPGTYEVVFEPKAVASALLFPAYLGFPGKAHADGTSFVHLGEQQWDRAVTLVDDAVGPLALGVPFDAEGTPKAPLELVRDGVSVALAHDRRSARLAGVAPTGHSIGAESVGGVPTDLFLRPGAGAVVASPEALVAGVRRGLLVTDLWYNRVLDPKSQVVTGLTRNGLFLVEDGRVVGAVHNLRYTQSIVAAFGPGRVLGVGEDAQQVGDRDVRLHVPTVRLAGWAFTGDARG